jgi:hypothetical protein
MPKFLTALRELADVMEKHEIRFESCRCCDGLGADIGSDEIRIQEENATGYEITGRTVRAAADRVAAGTDIRQR